MLHVYNKSKECVLFFTVNGCSIWEPGDPFACLIRRTFLLASDVFSLTINQPTVILVMTFQTRVDRFLKRSDRF